jgi:hypothetical protein
LVKNSLAVTSDGLYFLCDDSGSRKCLYSCFGKAAPEFDVESTEFGEGRLFVRAESEDIVPEIIGKRVAVGGDEGRRIAS